MLFEYNKKLLNFIIFNYLSTVWFCLNEVYNAYINSKDLVIDLKIKGLLR